MRIGFISSTCLLALLVTGCDRGPGPEAHQDQSRALPDSRAPLDHKGHPAQRALKDRQDCKGRLVFKA
jgi:hypothetical protein